MVDARTLHFGALQVWICHCNLTIELIKPHNTIQTLGRLNCLSSQNCSAALRTTLTTQQALQPSRLLSLYRTGHSHAQDICFVLLHNVIPEVFLFPHKHATKVILDAESNIANSSTHSQGTPGSTPKTALFKDAAVTLCAFTCYLSHKNTSSDQTS